MKAQHFCATSLDGFISRSLIFSIALGLLVFTVPVQANTDLSKQLAKAMELLNNGKSGAAASLARTIIASHPDNAQAHTILGAALASIANNNEYEAAIAEEETAIKLDSKSYWARKFLGQIYTNMHKTQEAISMLEEAATINPNSYSARRDLAVAQMTAGKNDDAIKSFRNAIQINPSKIDAHVKLSALLIKTENYKESIAEAKKAIKLDVNNPEAHLALGNALLASGDKIASIVPYEDAMQANMSKSYRIALTQANALSGLGWAFSVPNAGKKELAEAASYQRQAIKICPAFGPAYVRLAELLGRQGKIKAADDVYKTSVRLSQEDAGVSTAYARFLAKTGRNDEARMMLKNVLEKKPGYKQAAEALAELENEKAS